MASSSQPLHYKEITEKIISDELRTGLGATPAATVSAEITASIKKHGDDSPYVRVAKGTFTLAKKTAVGPSTKEVDTGKPKQEEEEGQYAIVSSFGMFWRREAIEWVGTPKDSRHATDWSHSG